MEDKSGYHQTTQESNLQLSATPPAVMLEAENSLLKAENVIKEDSAAVTAQRIVTQLLDEADAALKGKGRSTTPSDNNNDHHDGSEVQEEVKDSEDKEATPVIVQESSYLRAAEEDHEDAALTRNVLFEVGLLISDEALPKYTEQDDSDLRKQTASLQKQQVPISCADDDDEQLTGELCCQSQARLGEIQDPTNKEGRPQEESVPPPIRLIQGVPLATSIPGAHRARPSHGDIPLTDDSDQSTATIVLGDDGTQDHQEEEDQIIHIRRAEEGLAVASPVTQYPSQEAQSMDLVKQQETKQQRQRKHVSATVKMVLVGFLFLAMVVIVVTLVARHSTQTTSSSQRDSADQQSVTNSTQTSAPWQWDLPFSVPNTTLWILLQQQDTYQSSSPQTKAYNWISLDPFLKNYSSGRLIQRFALATFYYATHGENWEGSGIAPFIPTPIIPGTNMTRPWPQRPARPNSRPRPCPQPWNTQSRQQQQPPQLREPEDCPPPEAATQELEMAKWLSYDSSECDWFTTTTHSRYGGTACDGDQFYRLLDLTNFNLQGRLPPELALLTTLNILALPRNSLGGQLFSEIGNLQGLERLVINNNQFSGGIPSELGLLADTLVTIAAEGCGLTGTIPMEFWSLTNLHWVQMLGNRFSGTLPPNIGSLVSQMTWLDLASSQLSGELPTSLGLMSSLHILDLGKNNFVGSIPTELLRIDLDILDIGHNFLIGKLPSELGLLPSIKKLWLEGNTGITGQLPASLEQINNTLLSLRIKGTGITGTIPQGLCRIQELSFDCSETLCGCRHCPCADLAV
ncbi:Leucine Rich Repeat [Seminavis robusta]|uniref:Leucine Rich Repeat n=1 Tax=Seminavis robusta TaxID=568900 RepID=A0A9N8HPM4_9STRA|nr:Leucine Rich Repeat [Seminavis robusta]|eukprot:Sro1191_g250900.1 Leucine Rich Repeat (799) ;mRNA; r:11673-14069